MGATDQNSLKPLLPLLVGRVLPAIATATLLPAISTLPIRAQLTPNQGVQPVDPIGVPISVPPAQASPNRAISAAGSSVSPVYRLGPGDKVKVEIAEVPDFSREYQVLVDGSLNLPLAGNVPVQGMTLTQAENAIATAYIPFLQLPYVSVSLVSPRPIRFAVAGEVNRPGPYTIEPKAGEQFPSVTQALELAGGITQTANLRLVEIRRRDGAGNWRSIPVNLWALLQAGDLSQDKTLRDGDTLFIPPTTLTLAESRQLSAASFYKDRTQPINIAVVGEVARPGPYTVAATAPRSGETNSELLTVTRAIQLAGGIKRQADIRRVQIRRQTQLGVAQPPIQVNLWKLLQEGDLQQDAILQDGDTVMIPIATDLDFGEATQLAAASFSPDAIPVNVVGEVAQPGTVEVPPNTPLNQAILAAGGFDNRRARKGSVELIRLNANGTVAKRRISVNFEDGINPETNPILQRNDVVVVSRSKLTGFSDTLGTVLRPLGSVFSFLNFFRIFD